MVSPQVRALAPNLLADYRSPFGGEICVPGRPASGRGTAGDRRWRTSGLRLLCDRRDQLAAARTQAVCRLHRLLAEFTPGGLRRELSVATPLPSSTPLFSTGVMLAMKGASVAAGAIDRIFDDLPGKGTHQLAYERSYRDFFDTVVSFVRYFYYARRQRTEYWARAQELVDPVHELEQRADFIRLISGLAGQPTVIDDERTVPASALTG